MSRIFILLLITAGLSGCSEEPQIPLVVSDVSVFAPLPGSKMSVAYMVFENFSDQPISINSVSSPQFGRVEMHETRIVDGIARMRSLDDLLVPAGASATLEENGKHLMLMQPLAALDLQDPVSLRISFGDSGLIIISAPLRPRFELDSSQ